MDEALALYRLRKRADILRQPLHASSLEELDHALMRLQPSRHHPYSLRPADHAALSNHSAYTSTCLGRPARLPSQYLYRITTWSRLVSDITVPAEHIRIIPLSTTERKAFQLIESKQIPGEWLRLSSLITGTLHGRRGFTWWTSLPLPSSPLMCSAHQMGLLNKELGAEILVLRCPAIKLDPLYPRVPTVLDAFFSHIFCPMCDADEPIAGRAISVEDPQQLTLGAEEFVLAPLDVGEADIHVWPVDLAIEPAHQIHVEDIYPPLKRYYEAF